MAISTYLSMFTSNINGLNAQSKYIGWLMNKLKQSYNNNNNKTKKALYNDKGINK